MDIPKPLLNSSLKKSNPDSHLTFEGIGLLQDKNLLKIKIKQEWFSEPGDKIYHFFVAAEHVVYFGYILESLEGWAFYTTIDSVESIMHVEVMRDYVGDFDRLLKKIM